MSDITEIIDSVEFLAKSAAGYSLDAVTLHPADVLAIIAAYREQATELNAVWAALPGVRYLDPPDGGDVPLADQVRRMAAELTELRNTNNIPTKYVQSAGTGRQYCVWGTSSIDAYEALETKLAELREKLRRLCGLLPQHTKEPK